MNIKRVAIGTIAGGVVLYVVGWLFWENIFADFFESHRASSSGVVRETQIVWAIVLGTLFYAKLLTLTLEMKSGGASLAEGMKIGATVGFLLWGTADFVLYGYLDLSTLTGTIADAVLEGVRGGIGGAAIAFALSKVGN